LKTAATLSIRLADTESRKALYSVLAPDNEGLPPGLELAGSVEGRTVRYTVESGRPPTAVSTILALLRDVTLFQEIWLLSREKAAGAGR
jgi:hypothetical protein